MRERWRKRAFPGAMAASISIMLIGLPAGHAKAQQFGRMGGGIGPGSTVYGDAARGEGIMAAGLGQYNLSTAMANSINTDTNMRWNEYVYQSIQNDLHQKYLHRQAHQQRGIASKKAIMKRISDNPEPADMLSGDALNAVLVQLLDPSIGASNYRRAVVPLAAETIRQIPFNAASRAATFSMDRLIGKREWPLSLEGDKFAKERKAFEKAVDNAINLDVESKLTIEAVHAIETAIEDLERRMEQEIPQARLQEYLAAKNYLKEQKEIPRFLKERTIEQALAAIESYPGTSVGDLVLFMQKHGLRFGPAKTPPERELYGSLFENLKQLRDQVGVPPERNAEIK